MATFSVSWKSHQVLVKTTQKISCHWQRCLWLRSHCNQQSRCLIEFIFSLDVSNNFNFNSFSRKWCNLPDALYRRSSVLWNEVPVLGLHLMGLTAQVGHSPSTLPASVCMWRSRGHHRAVDCHAVTIFSTVVVCAQRLSHVFVVILCLEAFYKHEVTDCLKVYRYPLGKTVLLSSIPLWDVSAGWGRRAVRLFVQLLRCEGASCWGTGKTLDTAGDLLMQSLAEREAHFRCVFQCRRMI